MLKYSGLILTALFTINIAWAVPRQIIIIRHADKLNQDNKSPTVSAKGYIRAIKFAYYYMQNYPKPDYVFAKDPKDENNDEVSFRELQTLGPVVNMLAQKYPQLHLQVLHPFIGEETDKLADYLLNHSKFNNKIILICWNHMNIPKLAQYLGVKEDIEEWSNKIYDTVFIIDYNRNNAKLTILKDQFPVYGEPDWQDIRLTEGMEAANHLSKRKKSTVVIAKRKTTQKIFF